ncbi:uncharacterized protein K02A2.6-like [Sitodiplosis mosellana]|uniref:uncharacterized protein K02A2.6-like n=1 Tax=Sitodiplosis mosellana TaxID=263140 RepID=UPI0024442543|nr:uncharacterized protein K02A2.6-like [Sitodiplosis mosellana]
MSQEANERIDVFVIRLRIQADRCDFDEQIDQNIKDQITSGCQSEVLRRKILEKGDKKLDEIVKMARIFENVTEQQKLLAKKSHSEEKSSIMQNTVDVCNIDTKFGNQRRFKRTFNDIVIECGRCGRKGHNANDEKCPARGKVCHGCGKKDHFQRRCRTQMTQKRKFNDSRSQTDSKRLKRESENVNLIKDDDDDYDDVFCDINTEGNENKLWCNVGGVDKEVVIDSGTRYNVVDRETWQELKASNIRTIVRKKEVDIGFKSYGGHRLNFVGMFRAQLQIGKKQIDANFYVADEFGKFLIGWESGFELGILKIGYEINNIEHEEFGKIKGVEVEIPIKPDVKPVQQPYRRVPAPLEKVVDDKIDELLRKGIIEKVKSAKWITPLVIVPKQNDVRVCIDMRRANEAVERENHPLPTMEDFLPEIRTAKYFSKLDVKQAYHQVEIAPSSRDITAFITKKGLFRYKRLMFGITCAPEIFQKIMEQILQGCDGCLNYMDDVIVFAPTKELHDSRLQKVLERLNEYNVTLNKEKCVFGVSEIIFLGHRLSPDGIKPTHDKILAIKQFREPHSTEETRSYLGLVNYLGKFIPNLATVSEPLRMLIKNDAVFEWNAEQQEAFEILKQCISEESTLGYYNVNDRTQVIADASPVGLGAVLIQFNERGVPRIICYANRSLTDVEKRYAQTEKEALALIWAVERFHFYLFGREFELITDHKPLEVIFGPRSKPCARIERWVLRLQSYKYKVVYKPGKTNIADPLSRLIQETSPQPAVSTKSNEYVAWILSYAEPKAIKLQEILSESTKDVMIQSVKSAIYENVWNESASPFKHFETELCFEDDILLRGNRIVLPACLWNRALELAHEGHPGISVMKRRLRSKVWWPGLDKQVEDYVKKCKGCTLVSAASVPEPLKSTKLPSEPWQHIAIDFLGPLPSGHYLFVVVDYYSRFFEVEVMKKIDATETIKALKVIFARFGISLSIKADNGPEFPSEEFKQFCETNNIRLINTTPYWPQENGEVERQNRSLLKRLKISQDAKRDWREDLQDFLLMYRSTPHSTTGKTPSEMLFNRNIRDKLPSMNQGMDFGDEETRDRDSVNKAKTKVYADLKRHARPSQIEVGDFVVTKRQIKTNKLATDFDPTVFKVIKRDGSEVLIQNPETLTQYRRNVAHVKLATFIDNDPKQLNDGLAVKRKFNEKEEEEEPLPKRKRLPPKRYNDYDFKKKN